MESKPTLDKCIASGTTSVVVGRISGHWGLGSGEQGGEEVTRISWDLRPVYRLVASRLWSDERPDRDGWGRRCDHRQIQFDESGQEMRVRCGDLCAWTWNGGVALLSLVSPTSPVPFASSFHFAQRDVGKRIRPRSE